MKSYVMEIPIQEKKREIVVCKMMAISFRLQYIIAISQWALTRNKWVEAWMKSSQNTDDG